MNSVPIRSNYRTYYFGVKGESLEDAAAKLEMLRKDMTKEAGGSLLLRACSGKRECAEVGAGLIKYVK